MRQRQKPNINIISNLSLLITKRFSLNVAPKLAGGSKLPAGHPVPPSGQAMASKCPFLAAEMGQKNSSVVRQVGMEFQEDVEEVRTVQKGKICLKSSS